MGQAVDADGTQKPQVHTPTANTSRGAARELFGVVSLAVEPAEPAEDETTAADEFAEPR